MIPAAVATDRAFLVPAGATVRTGYVPVHRVRLACRERMAVGDVAEAYRRQLQFGSSQAFPPPNGWWEADTFVIRDGRHAYVSALMLGMTHLFVAWIDNGKGA